MRRNSRSPRRAGSTLLNNGSAGRSAFSAFFHSAHSAFSLGANAEPAGPDHHADTRRRRPFLNDSASLRGRLLNDVIVRKAGRNNESRQSAAGKHSSHGTLPSFEMTSFNSLEAVMFRPARAMTRQRQALRAAGEMSTKRLRRAAAVGATF